MYIRGKKAILFVEPCLSSCLLVVKAKEKGYTTLVMSAHFELPEEILNATSSFFHLDTDNIAAVLDLVEKIAQKFHIEGVIPGASDYVPLTAKVATYLNKPGLTPEPALRIQRKDLVGHTLEAQGLLIPPYAKVETKGELEVALQKIKFPCVIKSVNCAHSVKVKKINTIEEAFVTFESITAYKNANPLLVEEYIQGKEYSVQGFLKNNAVYIVSILEKLFFPEPDLREKGHIVHAEIEPELFTMLDPYLKKVISVLELNHGPFQAKVKLSEKGPILMKIAMHLGSTHTPKLIEYATGIDYYDNTLKLLSGQPLFLHKTQNLNAGITFLYGLSKLELLQHNPHVKELKVYDREDKRVSKSSLGKHKLGHAIFIHKDYEILKQQMEEIVVGGPLVKN